MIINELPVKTWHRLKMNEAQAVPIEGASSAEISVDLPDSAGISAVMQSGLREEIPTGLGAEFSDFIREVNAETRFYTIERDVRVSAPLRIDATYHEGEAKANVTELLLKEGASSTVIMRASSDADCNARGAWQTKISLQKGATLRLVQIQQVSANCDFFSDIGCVLADGARLELVQLILSGKDSFYGCRSELVGDKSSLRADIAYTVSGTSRLDMNYIANHYGRRSESEMNANGVLRDTSAKLFRGTIDFKNGARGAVGNEKEDVLFIDEGVINQTIPLILCAEEDVVGNHGATLGKLDEELLFYLQSRGLSLEEIYEMMARARIDAVKQLIADKETTDAIDAYLDRASEKIS